jgi:hypothetical protein
MGACKSASQSPCLSAGPNDIVCSNYVNLTTAQRDGLVSDTPTTFTMRVDHTTVLDPNGKF